MKLFVLALCCVVVLTTTNADLKSREELEKVLDELSNALVTADEAETEAVLGKGMLLQKHSGIHVLHLDVHNSRVLLAPTYLRPYKNVHNSFDHQFLLVL